MQTLSSPLTRASLRHALAHYQHHDRGPLPGRTNHLPGAVLVPLMLDAWLNCVVTVRPDTLRVHSGEVVFPGGRPDETDVDYQATALREAEEELGLTSVDVVGRLSSVPLYTSDFRLHPFVGVISEAHVMTPNPQEVVSVHRLSLMAHLDAPSLHAIAFSLKGFPPHLSPVFEVGGRLMYGGTAYAFFELLNIVAGILGREVPPLEPGKYDWHDIMPASVPKPS